MYRQIIILCCHLCSWDNIQSNTIQLVANILQDSYNCYLFIQPEEKNSVPHHCGTFIELASSTIGQQAKRPPTSKKQSKQYLPRNLRHLMLQWILDYKKVTWTIHDCLFWSLQLKFVLNGCLLALLARATSGKYLIILLCLKLIT